MKYGTRLVVSRSSASDSRGRGPEGRRDRGAARGSAWGAAPGRDRDERRGYDEAQSRRDRLGDDEIGSGLGLIYGRNPVREALRGRRRVYTVLLATTEGADELERTLGEWWAEARTGARGPGGAPASGRRSGMPPVDRISPGELSARLKTADHQDMAAVVDPYPYLDQEEILRNRTLLVALDEVQDPHNLGAIIRTAEGAGAGVLIPRHRAAEITGAVVKASAGATEHAAVARVRNLADFLVDAKKAGFWVYGAAAEADSPYTGQDYRYPTCFVVGSEREGLGRRIASLCDVMVSLPLEGNVESLNVSVATGILLFEAVRQRGSTVGRGTR